MARLTYLLSYEPVFAMPTAELIATGAVEKVVYHKFVADTPSDNGMVYCSRRRLVASRSDRCLVGGFQPHPVL